MSYIFVKSFEFETKEIQQIFIESKLSQLERELIEANDPKRIRQIKRSIRRTKDNAAIYGFYY